MRSKTGGRKGCKETPLAAFRYHQYPKHLAFLQFLVPLFMLIDIRLHFVRRRNTQRMGLVAKGKGELLWRVYLLKTGRQGMQSYSHRRPSGPWLKSKSTMLRLGKKPCLEANIW